MRPPAGFEYVVHGADVLITHRGTTAATLRGAAAGKVARDDPQYVMARVTGNYKRGSERR